MPFDCVAHRWHHSVADKKLHITLPRPARAGDTLTITIDYHGAPKFGLEFHPDRGEVYTIFSTSQWMPAIDAPGDRASLDLRVTLPAGLAAVGNGRLVSRTRTGDGPRDAALAPAPAAAELSVRFHGGPLSRTARAARWHFAALSRDEFRREAAANRSSPIPATCCVSSRDVLASLPDERYTQALVAQTIGQELGGFALMSEDYGPRSAGRCARLGPDRARDRAPVVEQRRDVRRLGPLLAQRRLRELHDRGVLRAALRRDEYDRRIERWRKRVDELKAAGKDHALVYAQWNKPTADDRAVVYQKGAYVLHRLRERLGDAAFWKGIRGYTRKHFGKAVTTVDFQRAMERASGEDLDDFFARWVYAASLLNGVRDTN